MNIIIVSPGPFSVPPVKGSSVEHDIDEVSQAMSTDHDVVIYTRTCETYPRSETKNRIQYVRIPYQGQQAYIQSVRQDLQKRAPDVILVENRPRFVLELRKMFPRVPIILNMHSHVFASPPQISKAQMQRVIRMMDGMITNSFFLRNRLIKEHRIPDYKAHAVHLGVNVEPYQSLAQSPKVKQLRKKLGLNASHRVLFFAGRLIKAKGVHVLLQSFQKVAQRDPKARLVIVGGTGYGSNRLNAYVQGLHALAKPVEKQVIFQKFVPSQDMPLYYQLGDVVATPSTWQEPFCRVNLEAMAAGKPVITSTKGGISEVVKEGSSGFLLAPADWPKQLPEIWENLWGMPLLRSQMSKQALRRAQEFSWQATAKGYLTVFQLAIETRMARGGRQAHFLAQR